MKMRTLSVNPYQRLRATLVAGCALAAAFQGLAHSTTVEATNSPIELKTALKTLMTWLPGQFDSEPQRFFEEEYKTPKDLVHGRVYRSFTRIDAPELGENVLVAAVRYGGDDGRSDPGEFQVWTVAIDKDRAAIRMSPRRFKDPKPFEDSARDASKFKGLHADALAPPQGASGCDLLFRLRGIQLVGETEPGVCSSVSVETKTRLVWEWEWTLNAEELWISFAGRDANGKIASGRPDQTPWRLGKARDMECFISYRPDPKGPAQGQNGFTMHDRGDVTLFDFKDEHGAPKPMMMTLTRGMWPSNSGRNYVDLLRLEVYEGTPATPVAGRQFVASSHGSATTDRVAFALPTITGRCKVKKEG